MRPPIDPRHGDVEDDASSSKRRSLLSLAGSLLAEISIPKLVVAWTLLIGLPGLMLGIAPIVASIWLGKISDKLATALAGTWSAILLVGLVALGWFGGRQVFQIAERSFWSLNSLAVQPCYVGCREVLRHLTGRLLPHAARNARVHRTTAVAAGVLICGISLLAVILVWPSTQFASDLAILTSPKRLAIAALANSIVLIGAYVAAAALIWAFADATLDPPRNFDAFDPPLREDRAWRIAHLSDIHVVGERYGFRIESGRSGPRGNERLERVLARLETLHAEQPLDAIVITGDMTDAGRSAEWAELLDAVARHPALAERMLMLPGNHDVNIVDRANPARLDLPTSPNKRLRKIRTLSAMAAVQGERVQVVDQARRRLGGTLSALLSPHLAAMATFADAGKPRLAKDLSELWARVFPMIVPPERDDGLGITR